MPEMRPLLGEIVGQEEDPRAGLKQQQIDALDRKLREKKAEMADMESAAKAIAARLYNAYLALQAFFEIYETPPTGASAPAAATQTNTRFEALKEAFPGRCAELVDTLLKHGPLTTTQIATIMRADSRTVTQLIFKLNKAGAIEKDGGKFGLKSA